MKLDPTVLLFAPETGGFANRQGADRAIELRAHGFDVLCCTDIPELYKVAKARFTPDQLAMVVLAGTQDENCSAAASLRALHSGTGIVSMVEPDSETAVIQALQVGADNCCPVTGSTRLLAAILLRLFHRAGKVQAMSRRSPADAAQSEVWSLQDQAWVLVSPQGVRIGLTTGERAFLTTLLRVDDLRATHKQLIDAISASYATDASLAQQGRLGVLVSRLRRKCTDSGIDIPLKSVHNWGYMFTGPV
jgi:DNA-binding response OmpR family regulator